MNRREAIKYSLRILRRKNTIISGVFLMLAFYWLYCSCTTGYKLYTEMSESVEIQCSIPENSLEMIKKAEEVSAVTEYKESIQVIEYQGYTAQVTLKGTGRAAWPGGIGGDGQSGRGGNHEQG